MATTVDEFGRVIPATAPLSSSRGPGRGRSDSPPRYDRRSGGRGRSRSRGGGHHHRDRDRDRDQHHRHHDRGRDRDWRKRPRSPSNDPRPSPSSQSQENTSPPPRSTSRLRHPSYRYVEEPMLCEYVWKSSQEGEEGAKGEANKEGEPGNDSNNNDNNDSNDENQEEENAKYNEYRKKYCLNYVRSFFNTHMDDSWFRSRYSPLGQKRAVLTERERAKNEAGVFQSQIEASIQEEVAEGERSSFVVNARLGGGVKTASSFSKESSWGAGGGSKPPPVKETPTPQSHILSIANPDNVLHIADVPPHVTDEQLTLALMDHCMIPVEEQAIESPVKEGVKLVSSTVSADRPKNPLWRDAYLICSAAVKQDIVTHLKRAEAEEQEKPKDDKKNDEVKSDQPTVVVPRKEHADKDRTPLSFPLDVECSDPYGRLEVDADGKGEAPDDGVGVPPRKSTVWVNTRYMAPPVQVLSAAISSKERIGHDMEAAVKLAGALDVAKDIPFEQRLDAQLDKVFGGNRTTLEAEDSKLVEDTLDVAIAYLRRVHLFSFYNGCTFSANVADVLSGRHPAGTVHMRLHNADEILAEDNPTSHSITNENDKTPPPKDLLVSRLDASIEKALEESANWINSGGATIVNERIDQEAAELEQAEEEWKDTWLDNHANIDADGRARCSFHFCHKLFKDKSFLRKHLQKKHKEFLKAEQAQLHDEYMMKAWDEEDQRPVPPVLVDCGANFDLVPSPVVGAEPTAVDPEPELWRKEEERRKHEEEMQKQREEQRRLREEQYQQNRDSQREERRNNPSSRPAKNFVDVDDMKEEKVEMSFDTVDVPIQPPKKKKKKKKLI